MRRLQGKKRVSGFGFRVASFVFSRHPSPVARLLAVLLLAAPLFAAREWDGTTSNYMQNTTKIVSVPFSVVVIFKTVGITARQTLWSMTNTANAHSYELNVRGDVANDPLQAHSAGPSSCFAQGQVNGVTTTNWHVGIGVWASDADRTAYLDGTANNNTTSCAPTVNRTQIGVRHNIGGLDFPFDGVIDRVCVFNRALTADEVGAITRRKSCDGISGLVNFYPMLNAVTPEPDLGSGADPMTVTGSLPRSANRVASTGTF